MKFQRLLTGILCLPLAVWGQIEFSRESVHGIPISGTIMSGADFLEMSQLKVQLIDLGGQRVISQSSVGVKGTFQLPAVPPGIYELRVLGSAGDVRYAQELHSSNVGYLNISLTDRPRPGLKNTVSALRLMHETPKAAAKELDAATKAFKKGNRPKAIEYLEKAAAIDADNFEALSNLGALYLQEHQTAKAHEWLLKAHRIDPADSVNNVNLSAYYANEGQFQKAEEHALAGLKMDPRSVRGRYMLAVALVRQGKNVDRARSYLNEIQNQFSPARSLLQMLLPPQ